LINFHKSYWQAGKKRISLCGKWYCVSARLHRAGGTRS